MKEENVVPVNPQGTYGIHIEQDRLNVVVYSRKQYTEDTTVPYKVSGAIEYKFYKAGDFGNWQLAPRPYKASIEQALLWVHELMLRDNLEGAKDLQVWATTISESKSLLSETWLSTLTERLAQSGLLKNSDSMSGSNKISDITTTGSQSLIPES